MAWLLGFIGALLGASVAEIDNGFAGFVFGAFVGALLGQLSTLRKRVVALERAAADAASTAAIAAGEAARAADWGRRAAEQRAAAPAAPPPVAPEPVAPQPAVSAAAEAAPPAEPTEAVEPPIAARAPVPPARVAPPPITPPPAAPAIPWPLGYQPPGASGAAPESAAPDAATRERIAGAAARVAAGRGAFDSTPREPGWEQRAGAAMKRWFTEGNLPAKAGMVVLFVGIASLLKFAIDAGMLEIPIELWFALAGAVGLVALVFGWRERLAKRAFGLALQGGGIGILLITVFTAYRAFQLLPAGAAFALVALLVAGSALLAILQNALALAVLGFLGGYLAPVLISTGSGNHVALFSYYAVLNAAVFGVAWVRPWRALNLVGFAFTFFVGLAWGDRYYEPEKFATVEPFLILFTLFYIGIGVLYALRQPDGGKRGLVDGTLVFGTPLLAFPLQAALLADDRMALAFSALGLGAVYVLLFAWLRKREGLRVLAESYAALALGFGTLAVPLALSAQWTATTWALEGVALAWVGLRQERLLMRFTGIALQLMAGVAFCVALADTGWAVAPDDLWVLNGRCLGALLIALAGFLTSYVYETYRPGRYFLVVAAFLWATWWWVWAGIGEIDAHVESPHEVAAFVGFTLLTMVLAVALRHVARWPRLGWLAAAGFAAAIPLALASNTTYRGPLDSYGAWAWGPFLLAGLYVLHRLREPRQRGLSIAHVLYLALWPLLLGLQLDRIMIGEYHDPDTMEHVAGYADGWRYALPWLPLLLAAVATWRVPRLATAPLADLFPRYRMRWFAPVAVFLLLAWAVGLPYAGATDPLPYVPLVNPVELTQAAILLLLWMLFRDGTLGHADAPASAPRNLLLAAGFVTLTFATLRAVHHLQGVPWGPSILDSGVAQTALSIVWSVVGVAAMIGASRRGSRPVWMGGATLMVVVLAKLWLVDRQYTGDIPGTVSFIAVGLLLVGCGYFAPNPPKAKVAEVQT